MILPILGLEETTNIGGFSDDLGCGESSGADEPKQDRGEIGQQGGDLMLHNTFVHRELADTGHDLVGNASRDPEGPPDAQ